MQSCDQILVLLLDNSCHQIMTVSELDKNSVKVTDGQTLDKCINIKQQTYSIKA